MLLLEEINAKLERLDSFKKEIVQDILDGYNLNKYEKLDIITSNELWGYDPYICGVFDVWENECVAKEKELAIAAGKIEGQDYICSIVDDAFTRDIENRGSLVSFIDILSNIEDTEEPVLVAICRGVFGAKIYKSYEEIESHIFAYAVENETVGFTFDW